MGLSDRGLVIVLVLDEFRLGVAAQLEQFVGVPQQVEPGDFLFAGAFSDEKPRQSLVPSPLSRDRRCQIPRCS